MMVNELELIEKFRDLNLAMEVHPDHLKLGMLKVTNEFLQQVQVTQKEDEFLCQQEELLNQNRESDFSKGVDGTLRFKGRICIPNDEVLRREILEEAHKGSMSIHPGATKMYQDLKKMFWWPKLKREVAEYVATCLTCQKAKIEHQKPVGPL